MLPVRSSLAILALALLALPAFPAPGAAVPGPYPLCALPPEEGLVAAWEFELWDARPATPVGTANNLAGLDATVDCVKGLLARLGSRAGPDVNDPAFVFTPSLEVGGRGHGAYDVADDGAGPKFLTIEPDPVYRTPRMTWSAWVNLSSFVTPTIDRAEIVGVENGHGGVGTIALQVAKDPDCAEACLGGVWFAYVCDGINNIATSPYTMSTGRWYHVAGSYDGQALRVFIDGVQVGQAPGAPCLQWAGRPLYIGARGDIGDQGTMGVVDSVRLYDRAVSPADLEASYARQRAASGR